MCNLGSMLALPWHLDLQLSLLENGIKIGNQQIRFLECQSEKQLLDSLLGFMVDSTTTGMAKHIIPYGRLYATVNGSVISIIHSNDHASNAFDPADVSYFSISGTTLVYNSNKNSRVYPIDSTWMILCRT